MVFAAEPVHATFLIGYEIECAIWGPNTNGEKLRLGHRTWNGFGDFAMCDGMSYSGHPDGTAYVFASLDDRLEGACSAWRNGEYFYLTIGFLENTGVLPNLSTDYGQFLEFAKEPLSPELDVSLTDRITGISVNCRAVP